MKTKILEAEIQSNGDSLQIKTNRKDNYKYVWIDADNLEEIANLTERL